MGGVCYILITYFGLYCSYLGLFISMQGLHDYQQWLDYFSGRQEFERCQRPITKRAYAR